MFVPFEAICLYQKHSWTNPFILESFFRNGYKVNGLWEYIKSQTFLLGICFNKLNFLLVLVLNFYEIFAFVLIPNPISFLSNIVNNNKVVEKTFFVDWMNYKKAIFNGTITYCRLQNLSLPSNFSDDQIISRITAHEDARNLTPCIFFRRTLQIQFSKGLYKMWMT